MYFDNDDNLFKNDSDIKEDECTDTCISYNL